MESSSKNPLCSNVQKSCLQVENTPSVSEYKPYNFREKIHNIGFSAMHHLYGFIFRDLIIFSYLLQRPLFFNVKCIGVIPPKPGVIFSQYAFFNFGDKIYMTYI
jgi:hypothetical protein